MLLRNQMGHIANRQLGRSQRCVRLAAARVCSGETRPQACGSGPRWFEGISTSASSPPLSREEPLTRAVSTGAVRAPSVLSGCGLRRDAVAHRRNPRAGRTVAGDRPAPRRTRPALPGRRGRLGSPGRLSRRAPACAGPAGRVVWPGSAAPGEIQADPEAERWRTVVSAAATRIRAAAPPGVLVEPKGPLSHLPLPCQPGARAAGDSLGQGGGGDDRTGRALRPQIRGVASPIRADKGTSSGTGLPAFVLPAISETTSATWLRSLRSTSWPPGVSPQPGSRCAAMRRPPNYCKPRT